MVLAAAAAFAGAFVQSATGFGFALILSPALFAVLEPYEAVSTLIALGVALSLLVLLDSPRPESIHWRPLLPVLAGAAPGLGVGLVLLAALPKPALQAGVGASVLAAALLQLRRRLADAAPRARGGPQAGAAVGLASGALTTSISVSGPPLVLWLESRGLRPDELRASLAAAFVAMGIGGGAMLLATSDLDRIAGPGVVLPLLGLVLAGHLAGARAFRRLDQRRFSLAVLALVAAAGVASLVAGLAAV